MTKPVVGILYPGDMGSHLGKVLLEEGQRVVTTVSGRSLRTRRLAAEAGLEILDSLPEVAEKADVILSLVPPTAAVALARECASCRLAFPKRRLFVDLNSISPDTIVQIQTALAGSELGFVDGAVHGMASQLRARGRLFLSGPAAPQLAPLFGQALRVKVVGDQPGAASALRMMFSGLTKGLIALFLEMTLVARRAGFLDELLACYRETYPALMALVDRLLPTYPQHASRRGEELAEVEQTMLSFNMQPCLVSAARCLITAVGRMDLPATFDGRAPEWPVKEVIEEVFSRNPLELDLETTFPLGASLPQRTAVVSEP